MSTKNAFGLGGRVSSLPKETSANNGTPFDQQGDAVAFSMDEHPFIPGLSANQIRQMREAFSQSSRASAQQPVEQPVERDLLHSALKKLPSNFDKNLNPFAQALQQAQTTMAETATPFTDNLAPATSLFPDVATDNEAKRLSSLSPFDLEKISPNNEKAPQFNFAKQVVAQEEAAFQAKEAAAQAEREVALAQVRQELAQLQQQTVLPTELDVPAAQVKTYVEKKVSSYLLTMAKLVLNLVAKYAQNNKDSDAWIKAARGKQPDGINYGRKEQTAKAIQDYLENNERGNGNSSPG